MHLCKYIQPRQDPCWVSFMGVKWGGNGMLPSLKSVKTNKKWPVDLWTFFFHSPLLTLCRLFCLHKVNNAGSEVSSDCTSSQALQSVLEWRSCGCTIALWTLGLIQLMAGRRRDGASIPPSEQPCWGQLWLSYRTDKLVSMPSSQRES